MFIIEEEFNIDNKENERDRAIKFAKFYKDEGLYEEAIKCYKIYIFLTPEEVLEASVLKELAICYSLAGFTAEAIDNLKKANKKNPDDNTILYLLAQLNEQAGIYEDAEAYYNKVIEKEINMSSAYYQLGEIAYKKGNIDGAICYWKKSADLEPTNSYTRYLLGTLYYYKRDYEKAEENFKTSMKYGFKSSQLFNYLGKIYAKQEQKEKARANFLIALEKEAASTTIYENFLKLLDENEIALEENKLNNFYDEDINKLRLGVLNKLVGNTEKAEKILNELIKETIDNNIMKRAEVVLYEMREENIKN